MRLEVVLAILALRLVRVKKAKAIYLRPYAYNASQRLCAYLKARQMPVGDTVSLSQISPPYAGHQP